MNLIQIQSKSKIALFALAAIFGVLIIFVIFSALNKSSDKKSSPPSNYTQETPIESNNIAYPTPPPQEQKSTIDEKRQKILQKQISNNEGDITLEQNQNYNIKYITSPNVFFVTIYNEPLNIYKQEAARWFLNQGLEDKDLCYLNVRFRPATKELAKNNPGFSSLPDGC
ncbi:MAG TPA: hypothetical protein VLE91_04095 [Candidatus Saccharimonadales bacterium]|nr:hypothetical protein [Candidatus Saccharimonadales bacterium]